jgi:hypothetical protein
MVERKARCNAATEVLVLWGFYGDAGGIERTGVIEKM